jgi:hypothetical protein
MLYRSVRGPLSPTVSPLNELYTLSWTDVDFVQYPDGGPDKAGDPWYVAAPRGFLAKSVGGLSTFSDPAHYIAANAPAAKRLFPPDEAAAFALTRTTMLLDAAGNKEAHTVYVLYESDRAAWVHGWGSHEKTVAEQTADGETESVGHVYLAPEPPAPLINTDPRYCVVPAPDCWPRCDRTYAGPHGRPRIKVPSAATADVLCAHVGLWRYHSVVANPM